MDKELRILILEDVPFDVELVEHALKKSGLVFTSKVVDTREAFLKALDEFFPDVILSDYDLPSFDGLEALRIAKEKRPDVPFILVTGKLGEEFAIEKIKEGATDYVLKGNLKRLGPSVNRALEEAKQRTERKQAEEKLRQSYEFTEKLLASSYDCVKLLDLEGNLIFMNEGGQKLLEIEDVASVLNQSWVDFWKGEDNLKASESVSRAKQGLIGQFDGYCPTQKGTPKYWNVIISPILDKDGKVIQLLSISRDITERKRAEILIMHSQIMKNLAEGIYLFRLEDGIIVFANPRFEQMFGYEPGEMIGKNVAIVNAPTDKTPEETKKAIMDILVKTGEWHGEVENIKKDGTRFWCHANLSSFEHPEYGRVCASVHSDITERKRAEEALRKESEFNQNILNTAQAIILVLDVKGYIVRFNPYMEEISGYRLDEVKGKEWFSTFLPKRDQDKIGELFHESIGDIKTKGNINPIITKDGREIDIEWYDTTIKDEYGQVIGLLAIGQDITERKKAEEDLKKSETKYKGLIETALDGYVMTDMQGKILDCNKAYLDMLGYAMEEIKKLSYQDLTPQKWYKMEEEIVKDQFIKRDYSDVYEKEYIRKDGIIIPISIRGRLIRDKDGMPIAMWGFVRDISEHKKAEEAFQKD